MSTTVGTAVTLTDVLTEGTDGQFVEIDLSDGSGMPVETAQITSVSGTLRSIDTGVTVLEDVNLVSTDRATYPGEPGRIRVTFTAADLVSEGSREMQQRRLTLAVTHSLGKIFQCSVVFGLVNLADA